MAQLILELDHEMYRGEVLGERFEFPANLANKYCLIHFLRGFKKPSGKQGLFSQEQIAQAVPDFDGKTRQSVDDHERRFRESGGNLQHYLTRRRKVDETVVDAVRVEVLESPLRQTSELVTSVNRRLNRQDLNAANIAAALESISMAEVRPVLHRQVESGTLQYQESYLLETMMETLSPEAGELAGLSAPETSGMTVSRLDGVKKLLTPDVPLGEVSTSLFWIAFMMRLFWLGTPLTVLGQWCHVHPTTVLRWILGLALGPVAPSEHVADDSRELYQSLRGREVDQNPQPVVLLVCGAGCGYRIADVSSVVGDPISRFGHVDCNGVTAAETTPPSVHH